MASPQTVTGACANAPGTSIRDFCVVTPGVLWAGARPDKDGAAWLVESGIRTIVNLELIHDDRSALAHAPVAATTTSEVGYFRIRVWEPLPLVAPSIEDDRVARFLAVLSQQPKPVYVHCRCGMKRTAVMVAAYRVLIEGVPDQQAIDQLSRHGGHTTNADANYIRSLSRRHDEMRRRVDAWIPKLAADARVVCSKGKCTVINQ